MMVNKNSMLYWWPKIKNLGIPVPRTILVKCNWNLGDICDLVDGNPNRLVSLYYQRVIKAARAIGYPPIFLRGDQSANKHSWNRSCYVEKEEDIASRMANLVEFAIMVDIGIEGFAIREFLPLDYSFHAFDGMPIAAERRYFVRDGKVECWHPYWPETAINHPTSENWLKELRELNTPKPVLNQYYGTFTPEVEFLTNLAEKVGVRVGGYWSVDFCRHKDGTWYLTDMAQGDDSYHWSTCKFAHCSNERYGNPLIEGDKPPEKKKSILDFFNDEDLMIE